MCPGLSINFFHVTDTIYFFQYILGHLSKLYVKKVKWIKINIYRTVIYLMNAIFTVEINK